MKTFKELDDYIIMNGIQSSQYFSQEETVSAIIGFDKTSGALVYEYGKLVDAFVEHFKNCSSAEELAQKTEEDWVADAIDCISVNVLPSLYYHNEGKVKPIIIYDLKDWDDFCATHNYKFDAEQTRKDLVQWIKDWFNENGKGCNAIIGLSGGKDSTIVAALCVEALGKDKVIGVSMPDLNQTENDAREIAEYLGIKYLVVPIDGITAAFADLTKEVQCEWSNQTTQNIPPRVRMTMLYAIAQTYNGRVVGTCNESENFIGYFTKHGDGASDFEPIGHLTVTELRLLGRILNIPIKWVDKTPDDGLPHSSPDEEKLKFTYVTLDKYIREGICEDKDAKERIEKMHNKNAFKMRPVAFFNPKIS